jgi:O-antigen biosynthesis protein
VYQRLLNVGVDMPSKRVALVVKGTNSHPATAHIRLLAPLSAPSLRQTFDARPVSVPWLLAGGIDHVDLVVAQRDAVPSHLGEQFFSAVSKRGVPLVFEVDDLLWDLPPDHTDHSITAQCAESMLKLAARADLVTVSTPALAAKLHGISKCVEVVPNALDAALWTTPIPDSLLKSVCQSLGLDDGQPALLYMGTKSHAADLDLIRPAIEEVAQRMPNLRIFQVGGGKPLPNATMLTPPKGHAGYRDFVPWFRAVCTRMTAAIAPLRDDEFNRCKSDIKTLDYGFGLVPAVFSAVGPYKDAILHEETGLLAINETGAWRDSILRLLREDALRTRIRDAAYRRALGRTTESIQLPWQSALDRLEKSAKRAVT